jgi:hypothetical protein
MGKYLDILKRAGLYDINDFNDKSPTYGCDERDTTNQKDTFGRLNRLCRTLSVLETRCPELVPPGRWQQCVADAQQFLVAWGEPAEALEWSARDLFGLAPVPAQPHPSYRRLSRYDETGLLWLLQGRPVVALTEATAAIQSPTGAVTVYRRFNKPALGPLGDSLDDLG